MPSYNWGHEQIFCFRGSVYQFWLSSSMIVSIPFREKGWSKNNIRIAPITNDSISGCKLMLIPFIIIVCPVTDELLDDYPIGAGSQKHRSNDHHFLEKVG